MVTTDISMPGGKTRKDDLDETVLARIDQYELVSELGGGGFGTVYLAKDSVSGVEYAVKGLPPFVTNSREELENIKANFALVSRLSHTNIARAHVLHLAREVSYSSDEVRQKLRVGSGDTLMVMEYAPGVTLSQWRKQFPDRKVPLALALEISRQIASALDYAHEQKILHRDIKPANVMIETKPDGKLVARVLDFGLAAEIRSSMGRVSREIHDTSGTRPYMAPEQWLGGKQSPATDQYALAVLFHELITGDVPFASVFETGDPVVMMNAIGRESFVATVDLPKQIRSALEKALSKKPEERYASCAKFVASLLGNEDRNIRLRKRSLIELILTLVGIGVVSWWVQIQDNPAPAPSVSVLSANPLVVTNEIVRTETNADVQPSQSNQVLITRKVPEERRDCDDVERNAKIAERKRQQYEAEAEIDAALKQSHVETRMIEELQKVWRKQVKSICDFSPPSFILTGFKEFSLVVRQHHEAAILAKEKRLKVPNFPKEKIGEIEEKMKEIFEERGLPVTKVRESSKLIQTSFTLAALGCKKALAFMFDNEMSDTDIVFDGGYLHFAAAMGRTDMMDFLIERGAYVNMPDKDGQTPVSWALGSENKLATVRYLIGKGASIYNVRHERSLLQDAASHRALDVVKYIIEELGYRPDDREYSDIMTNSWVAKEIKEYLQAHYNTGAGKPIASKHKAQEEPRVREMAEPSTLRGDLTKNHLSPGDMLPISLSGKIKMEFCWCPPGEFLMGSPVTEPGRLYNEKQHRVVISKGFYMGKYEVTQQEYLVVVGNNPSYYKGDSLPVEQVTRDDVIRLCDKLNKVCSNQLPTGYKFDIPTEAQWEYACRAGSKSGLYNTLELYTLQSKELDSIAWYDANSGGKSHPVGRKDANAWGIYDMLGNVLEWCKDWYTDDYHELIYDPCVNERVEVNHYVNKGGSFNLTARSARCAARDRITPPTGIHPDKANFLGVRLVIVPIK